MTIKFTREELEVLYHAIFTYIDHDCELPSDEEERERAETIKLRPGINLKSPFLTIIGIRWPFRPARTHFICSVRN